MGSNSIQSLPPKDPNQVIAPKDEQNKVTSNSSNNEQQKSKFSQFFAVGHEWLKNRYDNTYIIKPLINWTVSPKSPKSPDETPIEKNPQNKEDLKLAENENLKLDLTLDKENPLVDDFILIEKNEIEKNEAEELKGVVQKMLDVPEEDWTNNPVGKGVIGQSIDSTKINYETRIIDTKTGEIVKNPKKDENLQSIEKNETYTLSYNLLADLRRSTAFVVGNTIIPHGNDDDQLKTFLNACKSEPEGLGLSPDVITKLSKEFHQGLAGQDFLKLINSDVEPKGVMKLFDAQKPVTHVYTVNKSGDPNILTLTFQIGASLKTSPEVEDIDHQITCGVRASFNIQKGTCATTGAYAEIDPPFSEEAIQKFKNATAEANKNLNKNMINGAIGGLKINNNPLSQEQKKMIREELSSFYTNTVGNDWMESSTINITKDTKKIFRSLQSNPLFCIHSMFKDLKLNDAPLNENQKKMITDEVLPPDDESNDNNATLTKNLKSQRFRSDTLNKLNQEVLEAFEKFKDNPEFQKLGKG